MPQQFFKIEKMRISDEITLRILRTKYLYYSSQRNSQKNPFKISGLNFKRLYMEKGVFMIRLEWESLVGFLEKSVVLGAMPEEIIFRINYQTPGRI